MDLVRAGLFIWAQSPDGKSEFTVRGVDAFGPFGATAGAIWVSKRERPNGSGWKLDHA